MIFFVLLQNKARAGPKHLHLILHLVHVISLWENHIGISCDKTSIQIGIVS